MDLWIYNTLTRRKEKFQPNNQQRITVYVCGPTVYNYVHIGNARPAVVFDVLYRLLRWRYSAENVVYARNITDIDDKIIAAAAEQGCAIDEITHRYTAAYHDDMQRLGVLAPDIEPFATTHIAPMLAMIERLLDSGHAYQADGHVVFSVASMPQYGRLSGRSTAEMLAGARVAVADYKKDPADFVLWKPSTAAQPGWDSPWGRGRPGWHLECSAMIAAHLGEVIDIHGGGQDLIFPHHENEIAQSCCAHGRQDYVKYWMHNGYLTINGEKMAKSLGNFLTVHDALAQAPGEALRYALLSAHYRQPLDWSAVALEQAKASLDRLYNALRRGDDGQPTSAMPDAPVSDATRDALLDDLNTPVALAQLHALAGDLNKAQGHDEKAAIAAQLLADGRLLGLLQQDPEAWFRQPSAQQAALSDAEIDDLIHQRKQARADKNFRRADEIRETLAEQGIALEDNAQGTRWRRS